MGNWNFRPKGEVGWAIRQLPFGEFILGIASTMRNMFNQMGSILTTLRRMWEHVVGTNFPHVVFPNTIDATWLQAFVAIAALIVAFLAARGDLRLGRRVQAHAIIAQVEITLTRVFPRLVAGYAERPASEYLSDINEVDILVADLREIHNTLNAVDLSLFPSPLAAELAVRIKSWAWNSIQQLNREFDRQLGASEWFYVESESLRHGTLPRSDLEFAKYIVKLRSNITEEGRSLVRKYRETVRSQVKMKQLRTTKRHKSFASSDNLGAIDLEKHVVIFSSHDVSRKSADDDGCVIVEAEKSPDRSGDPVEQ